jgi:hypothetical protein
MSEPGPRSVANTANVGVVPESRPGRRPMGIGGWLFSIFFIVLGLYFLSFSALQFYGYHVGTPTTATDIRCRDGVPGSGSVSEADFRLSSFRLSEGCTATWEVHGQSGAGPIVGVQHLGSADVHVSGGTAYTAPSSSRFFLGHVFGGLFLIVVLGLHHVWDFGHFWRRLKDRRQ